MFSHAYGLVPSGQYSDFFIIPVTAQRHGRISIKGIPMGEFSPSFRTKMHLTLYNVKVLTKWPFSEQQERDMNLFFLRSANDYEYIFSLFFSRIKLSVNPERFLIGLAQYYPISFN